MTKAAEPGSAPAPSTPPVGRVVALPEGTHPWGVAVVDSVHTVYLAARKQDAFAVYDIATGSVTTKAVPGAGRMIDLSAPNGPLLLPAEDKATLFRLAVPSLKVESSESTSTQPHQAVEVGETTFVTEEYGHAVRALRNGKTVAHFTQPVQPGGITAVGNRVAAVDVAANLLFVYDATTLRLVAALPAGKGPSHVVPIGDSRVAVCDVRGNAVLTYDLAGTPRLLGRASVPGRAFWIGSDQDGTVYTALANTNKIAELKVSSAGRPTLVKTVPTVRNPVSFDRDPVTGDLYVGGYADSQLQVIPASAFR
ncbi:YncE family protein [Curtobacterium sp. VKM Ac-2922]|uniref:YncE family protein n=1 Tax=Curtobacterium sp. VKM Ac-2922 TaxID=2929475 RepID=UPI001FB568C1|nr:lactonase family protein [Curtobacterium sp. VKM Ac-2922]MCJ1713042.1 lactonase family protein [Curtobacterium sp. VKM Ac-2922]